MCDVFPVKLHLNECECNCLDFVNYKSTMVRVIRWCRQATSYYMSHLCTLDMSHMASLGDIALNTHAVIKHVSYICAAFNDLVRIFAFIIIYIFILYIHIHTYIYVYIYIYICHCIYRVHQYLTSVRDAFPCLSVIGWNLVTPESLRHYSPSMFSAASSQSTGIS